MELKAFKRKAARVADRVAEKSSDLLETGKTKLAVVKEEHAIDELFYKIGELVYARCKNDGEIPDYLAADFAEIDERRRRVNDLKNEVRTEAETSDVDGEEIIIDITSEPKKQERS